MRHLVPSILVAMLCAALPAQEPDPAGSPAPGAEPASSPAAPQETAAPQEAPAPLRPEHDPAALKHFLRTVELVYRARDHGLEALSFRVEAERRKVGAEEPTRRWGPFDVTWTAKDGARVRDVDGGEPTLDARMRELMLNEMLGIDAAAVLERCTLKLGRGKEGRPALLLGDPVPEGKPFAAATHLLLDDQGRLDTQLFMGRDLKTVAAHQKYAYRSFGELNLVRRREFVLGGQGRVTDITWTEVSGFAFPELVRVADAAQELIFRYGRVVPVGEARPPVDPRAPEKPAPDKPVEEPSKGSAEPDSAGGN